MTNNSKLRTTLLISVEYHPGSFCTFLVSGFNYCFYLFQLLSLLPFVSEYSIWINRGDENRVERRRFPTKCLCQSTGRTWMGSSGELFHWRNNQIWITFGELQAVNWPEEMVQHSIGEEHFVVNWLDSLVWIPMSVRQWTAVKEDIGTVNGDAVRNAHFNLKNHGAENEIGPFHGL